MPELSESVHATGPGHFGYGERGIAALVNEDRLRRILTRMLDENEFLSPYGIRALSRYHDEHPFIVHRRMTDRLPFCCGVMLPIPPPKPRMPIAA
jgi:hypothetical protein